MSVRFPSDNPSFRGASAPSRLECDLFELEYDGELPETLTGRFYRCGPDPQFVPRFADDVGINGDGMVSMFRLGKWTRGLRRDAATVTLRVESTASTVTRR
jgi:carotenoid cleavage dioxygenase